LPLTDVQSVGCVFAPTPFAAEYLYELDVAGSDQTTYVLSLFAAFVI
jgi:alpha-ketoglutarate-dependent taurine dioxygenase